MTRFLVAVLALTAGANAGRNKGVAYKKAAKSVIVSTSGKRDSIHGPGQKRYMQPRGPHVGGAREESTRKRRRGGVEDASLGEHEDYSTLLDTTTLAC